MRAPTSTTAAAWLACLLVASAAAGSVAYGAKSHAPEPDMPVLRGRVVGVVDGDTADVRLDSGPIRVRFYGIDAPEMGQPHGNAAKQRLSELIYDKFVEVQPYEQDRYDRLVARLWVGANDINAEMVKSGHAWVYRRYADAPAYCAYEKAARDLRRGLWQPAADPAIAPWEWRKRKTLAGHYTNYAAESVASCVASLGK